MAKFSRFVVISLAIIVCLILAMVGGMVPASPMASSLASSAISLDYPLTPPTQPTALKPSVDFVQIGLSGEIETDIVIMELTKEEKAVLLGTSRGGLYHLPGYSAELYSNTKLCCGCSSA